MCLNDEIDQINKKWWRRSDWRYRSPENAKLSLHWKILSWERIWWNKSDVYERWKKSDERYQTSKLMKKNDWRYRSLETTKLSSQRNMEDIEKYYD